MTDANREALRQKTGQLPSDGQRSLADFTGLLLWRQEKRQLPQPENPSPQKPDADA